MCGVSAVGAWLCSWVGIPRVEGEAVRVVGAARTEADGPSHRHVLVARGVARVGVGLALVRAHALAPHLSSAYGARRAPQCGGESERKKEREREREREREGGGSITIAQKGVGLAT